MAGELRITDSESLKTWLDTHSKEWAQVIACRLALRVLPLVGAEAAKWALEPRRRIPEFVLTCFRASFVTWAAQKYPSSHMGTALEAPRLAVRAISAAAARSDVNSESTPVSALTYGTVRTATLASAVEDDASAANYASLAAVGGAACYAVTDQFWSALMMDAEWLLANQEERLIDQPLWLEDVREDSRYKANIPPWARSALDGFANSKFAHEHGFDHWVAWYRAVIPNTAVAGPRDYFGEDLTIMITRQYDTWWERRASEVNADISD